jgi:nucleoside-diphosphate-sugar epimerase
MTTVAVTGCSGYVGRTLCTVLETDETIARVVGIDVRDPSFSTTNLEFYRMDVRDPAIVDVVDGCDTIIHLAAVNTPDVAVTRDTIVEGTRSVCAAAGRARTPMLIFTSTAAVYGPRRAGDPPLTEDAPLRPARRGYGAANAEAEELARAFAFEHRHAVVTILRLALVSGPGLPASPLVPLPGSHVQALHEGDAAGAIRHFLRTAHPGAFNVCAGDVARVDAGPADPVRRVAARLFAQVETPVVDAAVMSNERLVASGFLPQHSSADAVRAGAEARRGLISVGGYSLRPKWVAAAAGSLAALALSSAARAARARRAKA